MATEIPTWHDPPTSVEDTLARVRALLAEPTRWTQGLTARDAQGHECAAQSPLAVQWCLLGALWRIDGSYESEALDQLYAVVETTISRFSVSYYNDTRDHDAVLWLLDAAISAAQEKE